MPWLLKLADFSQFNNFIRILGGKPDMLAERSRPHWQTVRRQHNAAGHPTTLLSSEAMLRNWEPETFARIARKLTAQFDQIEFVAYLRSPAASFQSRVNQILRAYGSMVVPGPPTAAQADAFTVAQSWVQAGIGPLHLHAYQREDFPAGDVLSHFITEHLPELMPILEAPAAAANLSMSAEAFVLLQEFVRKTGHQTARGKTPGPLRAYRNFLRDADHSVGSRVKAQLHPEVAQRLNAAVPSLCELRDTFGIHFKDVDYAQVGTVFDKGITEHTAIDAVFMVNPERLEALRAAVGTQVLKP